MTLTPQSWLPAALELPLGARRRVDHDCGSGRTMIVDHKDAGWSAYCWRCSDTGFKPAPQPSMAERLAKLRAVQQAEAEVQGDTRPPMPANFDPSTWPAVPRLWLYKAGLSNERIGQIGAYYNPRLDRVVLPVLHDGRVAYWQARGFDKSRPKYLNPAVDKSRMVAEYGVGGPVVVTEDILSAVRVGEVSTGVSILGTALSEWQAAYLRRSSKPVCLWLDPDGAGRKARGKAAAALRLLGVAVTIIRTDKDPKFYSREEIADVLKL